MVATQDGKPVSVVLGAGDRKTGARFDRFGPITTWDARTGSAVRELKGVNPGAGLVAFSADGTRTATGGNGPPVKAWDVRTGEELIGFQTGPQKSLAFAVDGTRIVTEDFDRVTKAWDARSGLELKGEAIPKTVRCERTSTDGRFSVSLRQGRAEVISLVPDPDEIAYRRLHTQPNTPRYRIGYLAARAAKDDFATAFHLNLVPPGERRALLDRGDADAFEALNKLAREYQQAGKRDEVIPLLTEILNINKAKLGPDGPATIAAADTLGRVYHQTGRFEKAIPLFEDVLKARKAKQDPATPNAMGMLGLAYRDAGRLKDAIAVLEEGAKDWSVRQHLLDVYPLAGEHAKVITVCREQLEILRAAKDQGDVDNPRADLLARLGRAYLAQKKWADAETHLRECVTIREKIWPDHWPTFEAQSLLGEALLRQKEYADAGPLLLKGYEGLKQRENVLESRDEPRLPEALDRLIEFYTATDKPDEVKKWRAERAKYPSPKEVAPPPRDKK